MDQKQANRLGAFVTAARTAKGMSKAAVAAAAETSAATITRIEQGKFAAPRPDKLARIARALDIPLADIFAAAEYSAPADLPNFSQYMHAKYGDVLPDEILARIEKYVLRTARDKAGVDLNRPDSESSGRPSTNKESGGSALLGTRTRPKAQATLHRQLLSSICEYRRRSRLNGVGAKGSRSRPREPLALRRLRPWALL